MRMEQIPNSGEKSDVPEGLCRVFSIDEILAATKDFEDSLVLGQGGFATVYRGEIDNGTRTVAIKKSKSMSPELCKEFRDEILMVSKFRHSYLVSLIGYCETDNEMILVYEYMASGTLDDNLYTPLCSKDGNKNGDEAPLCWIERMKISICVARGLDYLHTGTGTKNKVIHRDIKSSNILLDQNRAVAKIADFGFSKIGPANQPDTRVATRVIGSFGYLDPDYLKTCFLTSKSDVYAFGVVLFELLFGRRAVDLTLDPDQRSLAEWARLCVKKGKVEQIIDPNLKLEIMPRSLSTFVKIANRCLNERPKERPTMTEVLVELVLALSLQETRKQNGSKMAERFLEFFLVKPRRTSGNVPSYINETEATQIDKEFAAVNNADLRTASFDSRSDEPYGVASEATDNADVRTALYDFTACCEKEMSLTVGERVEFECEVNGWFHVKKTRPGWDGKFYGWVPGNHLSEYTGGPNVDDCNTPTDHAKEADVTPKNHVASKIAALPSYAVSGPDDNADVRTAVHDYKPCSGKELYLIVGEMVEIKSEENGWFYVKKLWPGWDGKMNGFVPVNHLSEYSGDSERHRV